MSRNAAAGGVFGALVAFGVDIWMWGGETIVALVSLLLADAGLLVTLTAQLAQLANYVEWLDKATVEKVYIAALALFIVVLVVRLANSYREKHD